MKSLQPTCLCSPHNVMHSPSYLGAPFSAVIWQFSAHVLHGACMDGLYSYIIMRKVYNGSNQPTPFFLFCLSLVHYVYDCMGLDQPFLFFSLSFFHRLCTFTIAHAWPAEDTCASCLTPVCRLCAHVICGCRWGAPEVNSSKHKFWLAYQWFNHRIKSMLCDWNTVTYICK